MGRGRKNSHNVCKTSWYNRDLPIEQKGKKNLIGWLVKNGVEKEVEKHEKAYRDCDNPIHEQEKSITKLQY